MNLINIRICAACALLFSGLSFAQDSLDEPLASRGEVAVTHREFDARMSIIPEGDRVPFLRDAKRLERILSDLLLQKQLVTDAKAAGFDQEEQIRVRMELAAGAELAKAWLEYYIDSHGDADYESLAREQYLLDPSQYMSQPTVDVSHILISTKEREVEAAESLARDLRERLEADPAKWDSLVLTYSEDPSVTSNGGTFTSVKRGDMVKAFENAAFSMEAGEISAPVRTPYGFHIIRVDAKHDAEQLEFAQVRERLIEQQRRKHRERVRVDYLNQLGTVETDMTEEAVLQMLSRYRAEPEASGQGGSDSE